MRFQVPQFVDIEDKIVGPFTLKQFIIYVVAIMLLVPVYLFSDLSLFMTIAIPVMGIAVAFAHVKIHGKTLGMVLYHAIQFYMTSRLSLWRRTEKLELLKIRDDRWDDIVENGDDKDYASLKDIAKSLETTGNVSTEDAADPLSEEESVVDRKESV